VFVSEGIIVGVAFDATANGNEPPEPRTARTRMIANAIMPPNAAPIRTDRLPDLAGGGTGAAVGSGGMVVTDIGAAVAGMTRVRD
jgi:hypothetical protein